MLNTTCSALLSMNRTICLRKDVLQSLVYYCNDRRLICPVGAVISPTLAANEIIMNYLASVGHYPPKGSVSERREPAETSAAVIVPTNVPVLEDRPLEPTKDTDEDTNARDAVSSPSAMFTPADLDRIE